MVNPIVTGVLGALVAIGLTNLIPKAQADGSTTIFQDGQPIVNVPPQNQIQASVEVPITDISVTFKRITAPVTKGAPQIKLVNSAQDLRLLHVSFIPDATFKATGQIELLVNSKTVFNSQIADFTDTDALSLPLPNEGVFLKVGSGIEFNAFDASAGNVTVLILTGVK